MIPIKNHGDVPYSPFKFNEKGDIIHKEKRMSNKCYLYALANIFDNDDILNMESSVPVIRSYQENLVLKRFFDHLGEEHLFSIEDILTIVFPPFISEDLLISSLIQMHNSVLPEINNDAFPFLIGVYLPKNGIIEKDKVYSLDDLLGHKIAAVYFNSRIYIIDSNKPKVQSVSLDFVFDYFEENYICVSNISGFFNNKNGKPWIRKKEVLSHII